MVGALAKSGTTSMIVEFVDTNVWVYATDRSDLDAMDQWQLSLSQRPAPRKLPSYGPKI